MGSVATTAAIAAILAGEDLKIFAALVQTSGTCCWVVKRESPIKTIGDFVGKTVGYDARLGQRSAAQTLAHGGQRRSRRR